MMSGAASSLLTLLFVALLHQTTLRSSITPAKWAGAASLFIYLSLYLFIFLLPLFILTLMNK